MALFWILLLAEFLYLGVEKLYNLIQMQLLIYSLWKLFYIWLYFDFWGMLMTKYFMLPFSFSHEGDHLQTHIRNNFNKVYKFRGKNYQFIWFKRYLAYFLTEK